MLRSKWLGSPAQTSCPWSTAPFLACRWHPFIMYITTFLLLFVAVLTNEFTLLGHPVCTDPESLDGPGNRLWCSASSSEQDFLLSEYVDNVDWSVPRRLEQIPRIVRSTAQDITANCMVAKDKPLIQSVLHVVLPRVLARPIPNW